MAGSPGQSAAADNLRCSYSFPGLGTRGATRGAASAEVCAVLLPPDHCVVNRASSFDGACVPVCRVDCGTEGAALGGMSSSAAKEGTGRIMAAPIREATRNFI